MSRPISAELFVSLDLVVNEPRDWHLAWVSDGMLAEVAREQSTSTLLLGRRTYDSFAAAWPTLGDEVPLAKQLNDMTKVVVSDRLSQVDTQWQHTTVLSPKGNLIQAVERLDDLGADRVTIAGSISLVEQLLAAGLLAELRLLVHPVVVGAGRRLFDGWNLAERLVFDLIESVPLERGVRLDVYRPTSSPHR